MKVQLRRIGRLLQGGVQVAQSFAQIVAGHGRAEMGFGENSQAADSERRSA